MPRTRLYINCFFSKLLAIVGRARYNWSCAEYFPPSGKLPRGINSINVALIPKVK